MKQDPGAEPDAPPSGAPRGGGRAALARWVARRLLLAAVVVLGAATVTFGALRLAPGDPVKVMVGLSAAQNPEIVAQARHETGFDRPLAVQYADFLGDLARGDLGWSYQLQESVPAVIADNLWPTVSLTLTGFALALLVAVPLAVATAGRRPAWRALSSLLELVTVSIPGFWVGLLLLTFFSFRLHVFPATGGTGLSGLVLPAITLALGLVGLFTQILRDGMARALDQPFALSARARGTGETAVRLRHALRHALIAISTISGWTVGALLTGAVVVETVFGRPGLGRVLATAIQNRDFPVVTGITIVSGALFTLITLGVDLLYRVVDPRLREAPA
ncbi:Nickel transport system permease protein NikB [Actinomadura rubteroloni]|uniref:Nickel transport system permease protein NikB n=1 Tax=Actinomadura rubteroloni TaxID=1926885 RepID=A0A2P4UBW2_9ACTN|nr:ABC transporter permease [Actinomadura rubteroloni]POM22528.1 Nickel transport system permease protein NikB [Actinomadura rubteroloni]